VKRLVMVMLIVLGGCTTTWKQKDFEKELDRPSEEAQPKVATTKSEEKLLEKFEVQAVDPSKKTVPSNSNKAAPVTKKKKAVKNSKSIVTTPVEIIPSVKKLPEDYPPELVVINAKAKKVWDLYKPNHRIDEKVFLDINYMGMTVGKIMAHNQGKKMINDKEVWHFHARFKSAPFYSKIYELDDTVDTYVTTDKFLSTRYSLIQRETKQDVDDLQLHDRDQYKTFWFYHQKKSDGTVRDRKREAAIPYFSIDPFSVLFLYQGLPLKDKDIYEIPLINKGKILILHSEVEGREKIKTSSGNKKSIRVHATTQYSGETLKSGDLYFWFSDDENRTLLKAQAKIKIGSVTAEIVED
jgi:hypothetical protein